ncbi:hypothetical protein [Crocinitomix catalasitica]|uniref:hypothetical protein n=1 Tax=Crocinitomix catalasitica TaxID=184607 RepID=UPI000487181A|nr:hypothetical protein [Crocinitomix catalasitica]
MKRKVIVASLIFTSFGLMLGSCGGTESDDQDINVIDTLVTPEVEIDPNQSGITYSVPTPNELFDIIKLQGGEQQINLVNPLENSDNYIDQKSKSLNFGIYSADIAYLSCFGIGTDFLKYFKKIEELGTDLGISGAFDADLMSRIESNESNTDSLFLISNDSYYESYEYLEQNDKGVELSLIMAGGYIESLYIICNLVDTYSADNPIITKVGDQKVVLESLIDFIASYADNVLVEETINDLLGLSDVFENNMEFVESSSDVKSNDEGKLTVTGGGSFKMNEAAFVAIKNKANELREKFTK